MLTPLLISMMTQATPAHAGYLKPSSVSASTELPTQDGVSYAAKNLMDHKASTIWVEGDEQSSGLGSKLTFDFSGETTVTGMTVWNGTWQSWDFFTRHNRVRDVEVIFSDGSKETFTLKDEMKAEEIRFAKAHKTSSVTLKVKSIYDGSTFNDTALSEVLFFNDESTGAVDAVSWTASSTLPEDGDGSYDAAQAGDLVEDTMWCESDSGNGDGQWIEVGFQGDRTVSKLDILVGSGYDLGNWMNANRAKTVQLSFSDGSSQTLTLTPSFRMKQVTFSPVVTSKVRLTFSDIVEGKKYNDLCVSELRFSE